MTKLPQMLWPKLYFSKWPEAYAILNQEATTVTKMNNWINRFGVPMEIHSEQGRNFESKLFQRVTEVLGIRKIRTTPLYSQSVRVQSYHGRTSLEGGGRTSERLGSTSSTVPTGLSISCPWQDESDAGEHSFPKRTSSTLWHLVRLSGWRTKGGHRLRRWLEREVAERSRNGASQDSGGDWRVTEWKHDTTLKVTQ